MKIYHVFLTGMFIFSLMLGTGCGKKTEQVNREKKDEPEGIEIVIGEHPSSSFILHSKDLEILEDELKERDAVDITMEVKVDNKWIKLKKPEDLCAKNYLGPVRVTAKGDYEKLSRDLEKDALQIKNAGFPVEINPLY